MAESRTTLDKTFFKKQKNKIKIMQITDRLRKLQDEVIVLHDRYNRTGDESILHGIRDRRAEIRLLEFQSSVGLEECSIEVFDYPSPGLKKIEVGFEMPPVLVHFSCKCAAKDDELLLADSNDYRDRNFN